MPTENQSPAQNMVSLPMRIIDRIKAEAVLPPGIWEAIEVAVKQAEKPAQQHQGAPVDRDERAEFEQRFPDLDHTLCSHPDWQDQYESVKAGDMWNGWQARAALERKP